MNTDHSLSPDQLPGHKTVPQRPDRVGGRSFFRPLASLFGTHMLGHIRPWKINMESEKAHGLQRNIVFHPSPSLASRFGSGRSQTPGDGQGGSGRRSGPQRGRALLVTRPKAGFGHQWAAGRAEVTETADGEIEMVKGSSRCCSS